MAVSAVLYVRASTELQKYSAQNQAITLSRYASANDMAVRRTYADDGRSGLDLAGRPALRQLLLDVLESPRPFDVILVYDISRWGRFQDADEAAFYEHLCKRAGARVIYAEEPFQNDDTPVANVMKAMKRAMAAEYSRELSRKMRVCQSRMAALGFWQGGEPGFGHRRVLVDQHGVIRGELKAGQRKAISTDRIILGLGPESEVALVRRIFRMFVKDGLSIGNIERTLNREAVPAPRAPRWNRRFIGLMLRDERYVGAYVYNRRTSPLKAPRRPNPEHLWVRTPQAVPAIIPRTTFSKAQTLLAARRPFYRTDDELLGPLRTLFQREGRLSRTLIEAEAGMAAADTYLKRYGSMTAAYRLVGYDSPDFAGITAVNRERAQSSETLLAKLRALHERRGALTARIIAEEPGMSPSSYQRVFGSLPAAYRAIGVEPNRPGPKAYAARRSEVD